MYCSMFTIVSPIRDSLYPPLSQTVLRQRERHSQVQGGGEFHTRSTRVLLSIEVDDSGSETEGEGGEGGGARDRYVPSMTILLRAYLAANFYTHHFSSLQ